MPQEELMDNKKALIADIERLNQLLRDKGYGQGQIDTATAVMEELDDLRELAVAVVDAWDRHDDLGTFLRALKAKVKSCHD